MSFCGLIRGGQKNRLTLLKNGKLMAVGQNHENDRMGPFAPQ
jgi:hypothetical protein